MHWMLIYDRLSLIRAGVLHGCVVCGCELTKDNEFRVHRNICKSCALPKLEALV